MRLVLTLLFLSTLTTLIACKKDTVKAPFTPKPDELSRELYPRVVCEKPLADWLVSGTPIVRRDTGPLDVTVPLRLTSSNQYRFIFLDASGVPIRSQSEWRYFQLEPRNEFFLRGTALDTTATDWRCEIRSNR